MKRYGTLVYTRECVNLATHITNFTVIHVIKADFWSVSSMREQVQESERRLTKFDEITQCNNDYAVKGRLRSPILVPIESSSTTSY